MFWSCCIMPRRYPTVLPASALELWLAKVYERLHAMLADGTSGQKVFLWVVRCLEQLAAAWLRALGARPTPTAAHPSGVWAAVWDTLQGHLQMCGAPGSATSEAALHLLASSVQCGLVRSPQVFTLMLPFALDLGFVLCPPTAPHVRSIIHASVP